jgi:hypothetical protein
MCVEVEQTNGHTAACNRRISSQRAWAMAARPNLLFFFAQRCTSSAGASSEPFKILDSKFKSMTSTSEEQPIAS